MNSNTNPQNLSQMRKEYSGKILIEAEMMPDPIAQFNEWMLHAINAQLSEPNAMTLATATPDGYPSARVVLLKGFDNEGFVFFTNYESRKGSDLMLNPRAALLFDWHEMGRQVRVEGGVEMISEIDSDAYFQSRPRSNRIGAWASPQSQQIKDRHTLTDTLAAMEQRYAGNNIIPRPPHWGGLRLRPQIVEFWQGQPSRMHDRIVYRKAANGWDMYRLAP